MSDQTATLLLVEDDAIDIEVFQRGLRKHQIDQPLRVARDGSEALSILRCQSPPSIGDPVIILLDLNLGQVNGHEFLEELRADERLQRHIVFVLTSSKHDRDRFLAYQQNVAGYFLKSNIASLMEMLKVYVPGVEYPSLSP